MRKKSEEKTKAKSANTGFFEAVYEKVKEIPAGKVSTYGDIAKALSRPRAAKFVGYALHVNPYPGVVPCHRVVNFEGKLAPSFAFGGSEVQKAMLESEGVAVKGDTVDLSVFRHAFK